ncbi:probable phospholipid-transporting ATPase 4 [Aristolochia californica]|uniref:probable phospholipid-transporting ATPase 4 n=1 Tax=Aristolochia californica TaxID=171875 RepID=UPI0035DD5CA2
MTTNQRRNSKTKLRWSKLYSFNCVRPNVSESTSPQEFGGEGFTRVVFCNEPYVHKRGPLKYPNNSVSTTKYNVVTFLPKALFEQFRRVANLYFLLTAALSFTSVAPFSPPSVIAPLFFVVGLSMAKEAVEDWHRFLQDLKVNSRTTKVHVGNGNFINKPWKTLHVGDVVKVEKNEYFPSDLLLLSSSFEDGLCYVETMNLDGETNLKPKRSLEVTLGLDVDLEFSKFKATIRCEDPNPNLYNFVGNLEFEDQLYSLCPAQVLLRDSKLRNTQYIYGVVIFSGPDAKVVQNSTSSPSKRSCIERKMDKIIYVLFTMLILVSLVTAIGSSLYTKFEIVNWWYLQAGENDPFYNPQNPPLAGGLQFIRALMLYGYLIPISLYVSIEVVKVLQAMLINWDVQLFDEETCSSAEARTSNLNEELGQVEMILSDKTGTLTCNRMEFRKCSIAGVSYGGEVSEVDLVASQRMNIDLEKFVFSSDRSDLMSSPSFDNFDFSVADNATKNKARGHHVSEYPSISGGKLQKHLRNETPIKGFNFKDDRLMHNNWVKSARFFEIAMFLRVLALCHTGIPVEEDETGKLKYEAESPEEVAFLIASQEFGFRFFKRTQSVMSVRELDPNGNEVERQYKLLNLLEFSSSRKRMSVIVENEEGQIFLLCKGADSIILDRLAENGKLYQTETVVHLSDYAEDGLRTLAFAYRKLDSSEYQIWSSIFAKAKTTVGPEREKLLENASEMIEKDLILLGVAAVEDKLQKGVPECIDRLAQAGLKIWLLTGDKKETAVNIGFACSLLRQDMKQFHLNLSRGDNVGIDEKVLKEDILQQIQAYQATWDQADRSTPFGLVVDGKALELALRSDVKHRFLGLAVNCASVICSRVSPKQKALITRSVKDFTGRTTLAIGDGANDVGMIQAADIGVGISGMEGMQAVMASDFSLPQFHFLERLLIVHGHWCYKRISKMILYFVYKNIAFGLTLFYYGLYTSFSEQLLYDDWYMSLFNVVLTSLPVIALGVFEQDLSSDLCLQFPALYQQGQKNVHFGWLRIIGWIMNGIFASLAIFILNVHMFSASTFRVGGEVADMDHLGASMFTCVIWTVNCQIALIISHFSWIQHLCIWGSIIFWYIFLLIYGALPPLYSQHGFRVLVEALAPAPLYWLATFLVLIVALLPYFVHIVIQRSFYPMDDHVIQEIKHYKKDVEDSLMWIREQNNSKKQTQVGFSARVEAKIRYWKKQLHYKRESVRTSGAKSPLF